MRISPLATPDVRFVNDKPHRLAFYDQLDFNALPGVVDVNPESYAIVEAADGTEQAYPVSSINEEIPGGSTILSLRSIEPTGQRSLRASFYDPERLSDMFQDSTVEYNPHVEAGALAIVQLSSFDAFSGVREQDARFNKRGIAVIPVDEPLPTHKSSDRLVHYGLLGFITPTTDRLVTWNGPTGRDAEAIEQSTANALAHNSIEEAMVQRAIGMGSLMGSLSTAPGAAVYLRHYDQRHPADGTDRLPFMPQSEPRQIVRYPMTEQECAQLDAINAALRRLAVQSA